jgi:hypothetical protein
MMAQETCVVRYRVCVSSSSVAGTFKFEPTPAATLRKPHTPLPAYLHARRATSPCLRRPFISSTFQDRDLMSSQNPFSGAGSRRNHHAGRSAGQRGRPDVRKSDHTFRQQRSRLMIDRRCTVIMPVGEKSYKKTLLSRR